MHWLPAILLLPYFFLFLKIYRGLSKIKSFVVTNNPATFVSVVVACRNEQENLPILLDCINSQDYPKDLFEVIIVDDNSTDRTFETISSLPCPVNKIAIYNKGTGKKQAIRTGINASSGLLIITTDADCHMGKTWIRSIAAYYENHKPDMIICPVQIEGQCGFFGKFQELEFLGLQGITAGSAFYGNGTMCNGANLSFTREAYLSNADNLHSEIASGDDIFLLHSLKKESSSKISWLESFDTIVTTASSPTVVSFLNQRKRWISKGTAYKDGFTIFLGIVTFVTISLQVALMVAAIINQAFIPVIISIFLLKSVPDFLILLNTSVRYRKSELLIWFIPAQFVYPFYVLGVVLYSFIFPEKRNISSPFQKET